MKRPPLEANRKRAIGCRDGGWRFRDYWTVTAGVVLPDGQFEATSHGVPQGGPLSPLLANIVLDPVMMKKQNT